MQVHFFKEGFFGYSDTVDFHFFSFWHFLPIVLLVLAIIITAIKRDAFRRWKGETRFRYVLSFVMLMAEMSFFWRLLYVGTENQYDTLLTKLPIQLCQWGLICCVYMIISLNDTLFGLNYFVTFMGASIAIFSPIVITSTGPGYFRYYQFWLEHLLPIYCTFYAMTVHKKRPKYWHAWLAFGLMLVMATFATMANLSVPDANYLYLKLNIPFMPEGYVLRIFIYSAITLAGFHLLWVLQKGVDHVLGKRGHAGLDAPKNGKEGHC